MTKIACRWLLAASAGLAAVLVLTLATVNAATPAQDATPTLPAIPITDDQQCLDCHNAPDQIMPLSSGESLYVTIDSEAYARSIHAQEDVTCSGCHTGVAAYPHEALAAQNLRQVAALNSVTCADCHEEQADKQLDSIHQQLQKEGDENAAVCADCHNPHYTSKPAEPRTRIVTTCARCHSGIAQEYRESAHGEALAKDSNPDVPTCIDCHGVHNIADPRTADFLLKSPELCASCHADAEKMAPYKLNTDVLNTYVADFHGTTVTLFEQQSPGQLPNTPLCIDCHGIHKIKSVTDAESTVIKENLLATCQKCHPDATANFSDAWLSHYEPSPEHNPLVYYVDLFYRLLIPGVIGGMALFVVSDTGRRLVERVRKESKRGEK